MIRKVVNSYDLHVHGQLMRVVHGNEVRYTTGGYDVQELLLNEPRGSKYMNLVIYEFSGEKLHVTIKTHSGVHNSGVLIKGLIRTLIERGVCLRLMRMRSYTRGRVSFCTGTTWMPRP